MGISKQSIEDLKNKSKISDFILSSTTGKLRGNKGMALCPFHGEKTALKKILPSNAIIYSSIHLCTLVNTLAKHQ